MIFSSFPLYLDPPNWNQPQSQEAEISGVGLGFEVQLLQPTVSLRQPEILKAAARSVKAGPMAGQVGLAKVSQTEPALNCPRCDSTNTKFCYFNNYSLSQPRHFCKTCRRYWTRGGALRNVPVGGGCRRNKRSKSGSSSKSSGNGNFPPSRHGHTNTAEVTSASGSGILSNTTLPPQLSYSMASLHPLVDYGAARIGFGISGIQSIDLPDRQVGSSSSIGIEQWSQQAQQFPFLEGLVSEPPALPASRGLYPFHGEGNVDGQIHGGSSSSCGLISQVASVKMEGNPQVHNLPKYFLGNNHYWGGGVGGGGGGGGGSNGGSGWTHIMGFNSSSTGNIL